MEIIWSPQASRQIEAIRDFIAQDSAARAERFTTRLSSAVLHLERFPYSGVAVGRKRDCRQIVYRGYRIIYRLKPHIVEIVAVLAPGKLSELTDPRLRKD
jgi:plasmid stabilization system protein ParE